MREVLNLGVEIQIESEGAVLGEQVYFREDVDVWEVELEHGAEAEEENRDVFRGVAAVVCVDEVEYYQLLEKLAGVGEMKATEQRKKETDGLYTPSSAALRIYSSSSHDA